nr:hypothetical protein Sh053A11g_030 [Saccharum hybrid cultivar R570]
MARVVAAAMASAACASRRGGNGEWRAAPAAWEEASESRLASWPCARWCLRRRGMTASTPESACFSIHGAGLARVHDLPDEMLLRIAEKRTSGKATTWLCKVPILFLYRSTNTFSTRLGSARIWNQTRSPVPFRPVSGCRLARPA